MTMKKLVFSLLAGFACAGMASAQSDCMALFPDTKGTTWMTKCYDAQDNMLGSTIYMVQDYNESVSGPETRITYTSMDAIGEVTSQGELDAYCTNGDFFMKSKSQVADTDLSRMVSSNINLLGSFLDYPDTFNDAYPFDGTFQMDAGEFTIEPKGDKKDALKVRVYNRSYDKNEKVTTPAGTYDASKITYNVEVYNNNTKKTETFKNTEWYALGAGIVRSESHNSNNQLVSYTVLTEMNELVSQN